MVEKLHSDALTKHFLSNYSLKLNQNKTIITAQNQHQHKNDQSNPKPA